MKNNLLFSFLCIGFLLSSCKKSMNSFEVGTMPRSVTPSSFNDVTSTFTDLVDFPVHIIVKENNSGKKYLTRFPIDHPGYQQFAFENKYTDADASRAGWTLEEAEGTQIHNLRIDSYGNLQIYSTPDYFIGSSGTPYNFSSLAGIGKPVTIWPDSALSVTNYTNLLVDNFQSDPLSSWRILSGATSHQGAYLLKIVGNNKLLGCTLTGDITYFNSLYSTGRQEFEIRPADEFELINIEYINDAYATISQRPDFVTQWFYSNNTSVQQSMSTSFSQKATETSKFSQTTGGQISLGGSVSFKVGVPVANVNVTINTNTTLSHSATYGKDESSEDAQTYNFPISIAPRTSVTATATVGRYLINLKYKATMRGIKTGKLLTVNGIWEGISCTDVKVAVVEKSLDTGEVLRSAKLSGVPKNTFKF